jgi:hypothetical protein
MRTTAMGWVEQNFGVDELGNIIPKTDEAMMIQAKTPNLKGLKPEQIKAVLGKQYIVEEAKVRFPSKEGIMTEKPININTGDSGSGVGGSPNMFNWATGIQKESPYTAPIIGADLAKKIVGDDSPESITKAQEIANKHYEKVISQYSNKPYVSMTFKDGKDNPKLTYQGAQYVSNGFVRKPDGKWYMVGTEELNSASSIAQLISAIQNPQAVGSDSEKSPKKDLGTKEIPLSADVAVKHGFTGVNAVPNMIKFLNSQTPQDF